MLSWNLPSNKVQQESNCLIRYGFMIFTSSLIFPISYFLSFHQTTYVEAFYKIPYCQTPISIYISFWYPSLLCFPVYSPLHFTYNPFDMQQGFQCWKVVEFSIILTLHDGWNCFIGFLGRACKYISISQRLLILYPEKLFFFQQKSLGFVCLYTLWLVFVNESL